MFEAIAGRDRPTKWGWSGIPRYMLPWDGTKAELVLASLPTAKT